MPADRTCTRSRSTHIRRLRVGYRQDRTECSVLYKRNPVTNRQFRPPLRFHSQAEKVIFLILLLFHSVQRNVFHSIHALNQVFITWVIPWVRPILYIN